MPFQSFLHQLHPRHIRWWQWFLLIVVGLFFLLRPWVPEVVRQQILAQLVALTPADVQLGDVDLNLLQGRVTLQHLSFQLEGESEPALAIKDLDVNVNLLALLNRRIDVGDVQLSGVQIHAVHDASGQLNLSRLFPPAPAEPDQPPSDLPTLTVKQIGMTDSTCTYRDRTVAPETHVTLAIVLLQASQVGLQANGLAAPVDVHLQGTLNGNSVDGKAGIFWQREQTKIDAKVETEKLALAMIEPYLRDVLTVQKLTGQVGANIQYQYASGTDAPQNLLAGTVTINNLQFVEANAEHTAFAMSEGHVSIEALDLLKHAFRFQSIELKDPKLSLVQSDTGLNVVSWVRTSQTDTSSSQEQEAPAWSFSIPTVKWTGGELIYRDNVWPEQEKITLQPEEVIANDLKDGMAALPFQFRTRLGDGKVAGEGRMQFSPFALQLALHPTDLDLATLQPVLTPVLAAKKIQGKVTGELNTDIMDQNGTRVIRTHGVVETQNFVLSDTPEQGGTVGWQQGKVEIGEGSTLAPFSLRLKPALSQVMLKRLSNGDLFIEKMSGEVGLSQASTVDGQSQIKVVGVFDTTKLALNGLPESASALSWDTGHLELQEGSTLSPVSLRLKPELSYVTFKRISTDSDLQIEKATGEMQLAQTTTTDGQSQIKVVGVFDTTKLALNGLPESASVLSWDTGHLELQEGSMLSPLILKLKTQMAQLALRQLPHGDVTIEKASSELRLTQEVNTQQSSVLKVHGPVEFTSFALTSGEEKQILLGCYHGKATIGEGSQLSPLDIKLRDVALEYTYAQGLRPTSGQFQLFIPTEKKQDVRPPSPTPEGSVTTPTPDTTVTVETQQSPPPVATLPETPAPTVSIQIDRATILGGELYFEDRTVTPPQTVYWQDVRVNVSRIGYPLGPPAAFSAYAYNEDGAPVEFKGTTERKGGQAVVRVHGKVEKMSLSRFNSYLEPSLGYRVKRGAVTASWDLVIPGDRLQANMTVALHDIGLGGRPKSSTLEQQVGLPLTLVVALLKDLNGDINLQLPVEGRMSDPGVQWGGTVLRAVRDVLIGAVTSPLKVLGTLFQGKNKLEGFTLEPIRFVAGTSQMTQDGQEQLSRLALFLAQRPKIDLRFSGVTGPDDAELLRTQEMLKQLPESPPVNGKADTPPQGTPHDEVRKLLLEGRSGQGRSALSTLSPQANELFTQLQQRTKIPAKVTEQLASERVQAVITELTTRHAVGATRLQINPEKQRGAGGAEVRYTIQTREEQESRQ